MESTNENQHDDLSVLPPTPLGKQSVQIHKDTPLAMKTRHGRKKSQANPEMESPTHPDPPKTPPSMRQLKANETPRRSARKSVRPAMDYDDIMLRSATKEMSKVVEVSEEIEEQPTQKWTAAEVGRNSRKRGRKSKRAASKSKTDPGEKGAEVDKPSSAIDGEETTIEVTHEDTNSEKKDSKSNTEDEDEQCLVSIGVEHITADETDEETMVSTKQSILMDVNDLGLFPLADTVGKEEIKVESTVQAAQVANNETLDDLGLCPLEPVEELSERIASVDDFECEMPSLIMIDDDDLAEPDKDKSVLNTTFDAEEKKGDESNVVPVDITDSVKTSIKVVLTTDDELDQTLLTCDALATNTNKPSPNRSKGYRFPTPYKPKSRKSPKTVEAHDRSAQLGNMEMKKRRSNSASAWEDIKSRTVSFRSPLEVAHVHDIDKRWEGLNTTNVTNRRKRSKSMDESHPKASRIPSPKFFNGNQVITPSKVKKRTKLPNFAAIHQKQFAKMENLVDHLDRKAVRAKVLISSALKREPGAGSSVKKMPSSSALAAGDGSRPRALRKIDWCSNPTVAKQPENQFLRELHGPRLATLAKVPPQSRLPLKSGSNIVAKPAFNLSTNVVKKFTATSTVVASTAQKSKPVGFEDKVAERRQRHMQMFKSRSAPKEKTGEFIRGVRLNRRFELQMQHRRHLEDE
ncbi:uncharacterized protein LOC111070816 [Drosophila obscura]|uniref:uncharacterized protein LOC111070816 n=1 Tax=Drosophila obscura TaxID=7282 RepID=UPI001BB26C97|nr:uncharacterized protein LOC111070816 [Drosophila obscura]